MSQYTAFTTLGVGAVIVLGSCATAGQPEVRQWNIPGPGSTWTVAQHNTGSYGKDVEYDVKRGEAVWQGQTAVALTNSVTGMTVMAHPDGGRWMAIVGRDEKPVLTYDPPIGFQYPMKVGKEWATTHRMTMVAKGQTSEFVLACKVASYEKVTVRAGTFDAFRIDCKGPGYEDTYWSDPATGLFLKTNMRRLDGHPQGPGTQEAELVALKLAK